MPQRAPFVGRKRIEIAMTQAFLSAERNARVEVLGAMQGG